MLFVNEFKQSRQFFYFNSFAVIHFARFNVRMIKCIYLSFNTFTFTKWLLF